jgi:hypothetical protein
MMKRYVVYVSVALLTITLCAAQLHAQNAPRAVYFDGATELQNPGLITNFAAIPHEGVCSYWYNIAPGDDFPAVILESSSQSAVSFILAHHHEEGQGLHPSIHVMSELGIGSWDLVGQDFLHTDGQWHHMSVAFNTIGALALHSNDGLLWPWDPSISAFYGPAGFNFNLAGNLWSVGAEGGGAPNFPTLIIDNVYYGSLIAPYVGSLSELICDFHNGVYSDITAPNRFKQGFAIKRPTISGVSPLELGLNAIQVFGYPATISMKAMPGSDAAQSFKANNIGDVNSAFTVGFGALLPGRLAIGDPFMLWNLNP